MSFLQDAKGATRAIPADVRDESVHGPGVSHTDEQPGLAALYGQNKAPGRLDVWVRFQGSSRIVARLVLRIVAHA